MDVEASWLRCATYAAHLVILLYNTVSHSSLDMALVIIEFCANPQTVLTKLVSSSQVTHLSDNIYLLLQYVLGYYESTKNMTCYSNISPLVASLPYNSSNAPA